MRSAGITHVLSLAQRRVFSSPYTRRCFSSRCVVHAPAVASGSASAGTGSGSAVSSSGSGLLGGSIPATDPALLNPDAPYPIWLFDPAGSWYSFFLSVARTFAGILENVHDVTGLPWWGTVVAGSLLVRVVYFPVNCYSLRNASRFFDAKSDIQALQRSHRAALASLVSPDGGRVCVLALIRWCGRQSL